MRECARTEAELRIRSIKPEFWRSDDIAALPISARLLFIGLWSYVDDNGVGLDKLPAIAADLFADDLSVDPTETLRRVAGDSTCLSEAGLIQRYEADGKRLLFITNWESHQIVKNPSRGHCYPLPSAEKLAALKSLRRPSVDPTEGLPPGAGEQGSRGTGEQGKKLSNDLEESADCNVREFSQSDLQAASEVLAGTGVAMDLFTTEVAVTLITEPATEPVRDLPAYIQSAVDISRDRVVGLCHEATRQTSLMRA